MYIVNKYARGDPQSQLLPASGHADCLMNVLLANHNHIRLLSRDDIYNLPQNNPFPTDCICSKQYRYTLNSSLFMKYDTRKHIH